MVGWIYLLHKTVQQCDELSQLIKELRKLAEEYGSFLQLHHNLRANLSTLNLSISDMSTHLLSKETRNSLESKYETAQDLTLQTNLSQNRSAFEEKLNFYQLRLRLDDLPIVENFVQKQLKRFKKEEQRHIKLLQKRTATDQKIKDIQKQLTLHASVPKQLQQQLHILEKQLSYNKKLHQMLGMRGSGRNTHVLFEEKSTSLQSETFHQSK